VLYYKKKQGENKMAVIPKKTKNQMNKVLGVLSSFKYDEIPLDKIFETLHREGYYPLQEDYTPWSGFLCGREGHMFLEIGYGEQDDRGMFTTIIKNACLAVSWYKFSNNRYEVLAYVS
jgi:hypothetical protein